MSIPINDTFQVRIQGQLVDCIKAEAYSREVEKNSYSIFYCDYEKIKYLIGLKMVSDQADNSSLWVSLRCSLGGSSQVLRGGISDRDQHNQSGNQAA